MSPKNIVNNVKVLTTKEYSVILLFSFVILYFTIPPFNFLFSSISMFTPYVVGVLACILAAPTFGRTRMFMMAFLYAVVLQLNAHYKAYVNWGNVLSESSSIIFTGFIVYYVLKLDVSQRLSKTIISLFVIFLIINAIQTYIFSRSIPGIMRWAAMCYNKEAAMPYFALGLARYTFPHCLACIIPAFVLGLKIKGHSKRKRLFVLALLVLSLLLIYITEATGALVVALFALICAWVSKVGKLSNNLKKLALVSFFLVPIALSEDVQLGIINMAEEFVGDDSHYIPKLEELKLSVTTDIENDGDINYRGNLLSMTLESIAESPIIGVSEKTFGNHNALPDRWAQYGLIGFLPIVLYIFWMVRFILGHIPINIRTFYLIGVAANLMMMFSKSMFAWDQWFAFLVILPLMVLFCGKLEFRKKQLYSYE